MSKPSESALKRLLDKYKVTVSLNIDSSDFERVSFCISSNGDGLYHVYKDSTESILFDGPSKVEELYYGHDWIEALSEWTDAAEYHAE